MFDFLDDIPLVGDVIEVAEGVVNGVADAVRELPVVGELVETSAPFAGIIGTAFGGPFGGVIGGAVGSAFGEGGFDFVDDGIAVFGGPLTGGFGGLADDLLGGGSLIDPFGSVLGAAGIPGAGDLAGLLGGGSLEGLAGDLLGGGGLQTLLGDTAGVFGGLGLSGFGSGPMGLLGDVVPGLSDPTGWLGGLPTSLPAGTIDLPFGLGTLPMPHDIIGPLSTAGGSWMEQLSQQIDQIQETFPGMASVGGPFELLNTLEERLDAVATTVATTLAEPQTRWEELLEGISDATAVPPSFDDLVGTLPDFDRATNLQDAVQQLVGSGGLATLSHQQLTDLVTQLAAAPVTTPEALDDVFADEFDPATSEYVSPFVLDNELGDDIVMNVSAADTDATVGVDDALGQDALGADLADVQLETDTGMDEFSQTQPAFETETDAGMGSMETEAMPEPAVPVEPEPTPEFEPMPAPEPAPVADQLEADLGAIADDSF